MLQHSTRSMKIALLKPAEDTDGLVGEALQLIDTMLWVFRGVTRSNWSISPAAEANVVVVHHEESPAVIAEWKSKGKVIVVVSTSASRGTKISNHTLVYPFPAQQVQNLLERIDAELSGETVEGSTKTVSNAQLNAHAAAHADTIFHPWTLGEAIRQMREVPISDRWFVVSNEGTPLLWLSGDGLKYQCTTGIGFAIQRGRLPVNAVDVQPTESAGGMPEHPGDQLAWHVGYYLNPMLAPWIDQSLSYKLVRWPDFGRLRARDFVTMTTQLRVVAALDALPCKPSVLARRARVTREQAARTLNALALCGFAIAEEIPQRGTSRTTYAAPKPAGGLKQFFRKLRKHMRSRTAQ